MKQNNMTETISKKSRLVALLLSGFVGTLGIHRMYVGKVGTGIAQLILSITFIGLFVSSIWNLVDFIMIIAGTFTDKQGNKIQKWVD